MTNERDEVWEAYLEGEIPFEELPSELQSQEAWLARTLGEADAGVHAPPGLRTAVMAEIRRIPRSRWQSVLDWFFRPQNVRVTPATAGVLAMAALGVLFLLPAGPEAGQGVPADGGVDVPVGGIPAVQATDASGSLVLTRFVFVAPDAESVALTGDWLGWDAEQIELQELRGSGVWTVDVPVPPGVHEYSFVVDGTEWRPDPLAGSQTDDGFGRVNSVLMVSSEA